MSDIGSEEAKEKENSWVKNKRTNVRTVKWNRNKQTKRMKNIRLNNMTTFGSQKNYTHPEINKMDQKSGKKSHQYWTLKSEKKSKYY